MAIVDGHVPLRGDFLGWAHPLVCWVPGTHPTVEWKSIACMWEELRFSTRGDGIIGVSDTLEILASFGCVGSGCVGDIDGDTIVGVSDILQLLSVFGANC